MNWGHITWDHITCQICGVTEQHNLSCDCYEKESKKLIKRTIGAEILKSFVKMDRYNCTRIYQELRTDDKIWRLSVCIQCFSGDSNESCRQKVELVEVEQFYKIMEAESEDEEEDDEGDDEDEITINIDNDVINSDEENFEADVADKSMETYRQNNEKNLERKFL
jgi:hypothetical protein